MRVDRDIKRLSQSGILESFRLSVFLFKIDKKYHKKKNTFTMY